MHRRQEFDCSGTLAGSVLNDCPLCCVLAGAAKIVPDEPEPFIILGVLCVIAGKYEEAIDYMKAALENDPTDYTLWNKLGAVQTHSSQVCAPAHARPPPSSSLLRVLTQPFVPWVSSYVPRFTA